MSNSQYKSRCATHNTECTLFCMECQQFKCPSCKEPHLFNAKILNAWYIDKYTQLYKEHKSLISQDTADMTKKSLQTKFNQIIADLISAFSSALDMLNCYIGPDTEYEIMMKEIETLKLTDQTLNMLNNVAEKMPSHTIGRDKSYQNYVKRLGMTLDSMSESLNKLKDTSKKNEKQVELSDDKILHFLSGNTLTTIDKATHAFKKVSLDASIKGYSDSISCCNRIFNIGGEGPVADCYEVDITTAQLVAKEPMICKKKYHTLCSSCSYIYSIGGSTNGSDSLPDCERYSLDQNSWMALPSLLNPRCVAAAFIFNDEYIYAFAGYGKGDLNSMEKLNILTLKCWENVVVANAPSVRQCLQGIQINDKEALIFGGTSCGLESYIVRMDSTSATFIKADNLKSSSQFYYTSAPIFDGTNVYAVSSIKKVHTFSIDKMSWQQLN